MSPTRPLNIVPAMAADKNSDQATEQLFNACGDQM
jgi:hypothetical protein